MYKVYLQNNDSSVKAIRKFGSQTSSQFHGTRANCHLSFNEFCQKIISIFPELSDKEFIVSWEDTEGDQILISSDEELQIARDEMRQHKKIYIKPLSPEKKVPSHEKEKVVHSDVYCDGCDNDIVGFRYKCIQCEDYDLCEQCEIAQMHSHHYMIRMPHPIESHHARSMFHHLKKILKKNSAHFNKKYTCDENKSQSNNHHNIHPWLGIYAPYLQNLIDTIVEAHTVDPESSKSHKPEERKESKDDTCTDKNNSRKFPGEGRKLLDNAKDDIEPVSDVASATSQDSATTKVAADEWTIIDKNDTTEVNQTSSASSNMNGTGTKQTCSSSTAPPSAGSSAETLYPELSRETNYQEIYHENPKINEAVKTMIKMGFSNQSGLLTYLLGVENGNIDNVLEILQPTNK
ncbi:sequestosome-1 isoform X2 [Bombus pascuorum]|uniref:sequestosome-1 isoform X2 n=1 Tax=Bombus pascuorum TaxID=65598 RepID=UPI00298E8CA0|nr:sequestosome-1 isoform X2 [Bombus pascuorum]